MKSKQPGNKTFFYILIRSWNSYNIFDRCVDSVLSQVYPNYKILFVDDASGYTPMQKKYIRTKLRGHICIFNKKRRYSVFNAYSLIHKYAKNDNAVIFNLDGDDWLADKNALSSVARIYEKNPHCLLTYGECLVWNGSLSGEVSRNILKKINVPYRRGVIENRLYRTEPFLPLHPRTWKVWLFKKIAQRDFKDDKGNWLRFAEDQAIFYPMLEMADGNFEVIGEPLSVYNIQTDNSDDKRNVLNLVRDELIIRKKNKYAPIR